MSNCVVSRRNNRKKNKEQRKESKKKYYLTYREKILQKEKQRRELNKQKPTACDILKTHHEAMKNDPEHLTTDFIKKIINIDCKYI